jgi:ABC-type multidrug transport system ATPase subunit
VNGERIKQVELQEGDLIQISKYLLLFQDGRLVPYESGGMRLDISGLSKDANGKRILDDVNFSVMPREFIALVGGNASGRPALLDALTGVHRADGHVMLNGYDFYREYESLRSHVGYVPQAETLHEGLTVEQVLDYATRLRLPSNLTREERTRLTDAALESISMNTDAIRRTRISDLPLDERKRIGIAVELLADPKIIYLDEITLGLDPGREKKMMYILRRMADEGRTVVLATHATNNLLQTDHSAILSEGKLVYFGPSNEALEFFEAEEFADIYEHIEQKGDEWRKVFEEKKPEQHKKYVQERKKNIPATPKRPLPKDTFGITSFFSQLLILTQRNWDVNKGDRVRLLLMFLLFPITALLQLTIARPDILTGNHAILADPVSAAGAMSASYAPFAHTNAFIFLMGFESVLAGMFLPLTDLTRERPIFLRECVINLRALSYLLSKVFIYIAFAIAQVFLYMLILSLGVDYPANGLSFSGGFEIYMTLFLAMATGISLGLLISAVSKSSETAIQIFMVVLIFQFLFAGALFDLQGNNLESLSNVTATRWAQTALGVTIDMNKIVEGTILCNEELDCFNYPAAKDDLSLNYDDGQLTRSWSALALMSILSLAMTWFLLRRIGSSAT